MEINCQTDFVARRKKFKDLAKNIAIQIASNIEITEIPEDYILEFKKEVRKFEDKKDDLQNKPDEI